MAGSDHEGRSDSVPWSEWLGKTVEVRTGAGAQAFTAGHRRIAQAVIEHGGVASGQRMLDVGAGTGLLAFTMHDTFGDGVEVIGVDVDPECLTRCRLVAAERGARRLAFLQADAAAMPLDTASVDAVLCRSVLCHIPDRVPVFREWHRVLKPRGRFSFYEPVDRYETRFCDMVDFSPLGELAGRLRQAEEQFHHCPDSSLMNFDEGSLRQLLQEAGFGGIEFSLGRRTRDYPMTARGARDWWHLDVTGEPTPGHPSPYDQLRRYLPAADLDACVDFFCRQVDGRTVAFQTSHLFMWGSKQ